MFLKNKIYLASKSPRRNELLRGMGFDFEVMPTNVKEEYPSYLFPAEVAVQGPPTVVKHGKITIAPWLDDSHLAAYLLGAERIICRSGYSTVMDMYALGVMHKVEWHPTPGQPEQEYLAEYLKDLNR